MNLEVLALQPYFGGSHAQFHHGWLAHSNHSWTTLELPARHWKWRMRHAAIHFSEQIHELTEQGKRWDVIFATDMMNIAELNGLLRRELQDVPIVLYFHENQFVYPNQFGQERDRHFPFTNFISAIAADEIWFNSQFNLDSLIEELGNASRRWPDFRPTSAIETLASKSRIEPPGVEPPPLDMTEICNAREQRAQRGAPIHIVWAARWEHDKNPNRLFDALRLLDDDGVEFRLSVIGQSFRTVPPVFEEIRNRFSDRIVRWGYQESRAEYWRALAEGDVFISTAAHEFFGLSAAEAIAVGTTPLLPNRLAYPELLGYAVQDSADRDQVVESYLYDDVNPEASEMTSQDGLVAAIKKIVQQGERQPPNATADLADQLLARLALPVRAKELDVALVDAAKQ